MNYDEAIKIMQETETVDENNIIEKLMECFENGKVMAFKKGEYEIVISSLQRAMKEHELLGLYKEKDKYPDDSNQCRDICIKITELERELK